MKPIIRIIFFILIYGILNVKVIADPQAGSHAPESSGIPDAKPSSTMQPIAPERTNLASGPQAG